MKLPITMFIVSLSLCCLHSYLGQKFPAIVWGLGAITWAINVKVAYKNKLILKKLDALNNSVTAEIDPN